MPPTVNLLQSKSVFSKGFCDTRLGTVTPELVFRTWKSEVCETRMTRQGLIQPDLIWILHNDSAAERLKGLVILISWEEVVSIVGSWEVKWGALYKTRTFPRRICSKIKMGSYLGAFLLFWATEFGLEALQQFILHWQKGKARGPQWYLRGWFLQIRPPELRSNLRIVEKNEHKNSKDSKFFIPKKNS